MRTLPHHALEGVVLLVFFKSMDNLFDVFHAEIGIFFILCFVNQFRGRLQRPCPHRAQSTY
ncbi:hypothetical protein [Allofranklinella schreckenbergeri]|uniref:hypothetical protein n=1 Tax=Allofranklinella schreckenbergeri TaxID=1076744 RepID=UPI0011C3C8A3|nr:hypothetical protein [Allofranklinella schreckenbergeri]